jgi:hypothetical protein
VFTLLAGNARSWVADMTRQVIPKDNRMERAKGKYLTSVTRLSWEDREGDQNHEKCIKA